VDATLLKVRDVRGHYQLCAAEAAEVLALDVYNRAQAARPADHAGLGDTPARGATAGRYVMLARQAGHLPRTTPGKKKA
jgi:hypothetical protein